ncbi:hypothetical protein EGW08_012423, partial [Elysia chlorotica]
QRKEPNQKTTARNTFSSICSCQLLNKCIVERHKQNKKHHHFFSHLFFFHCTYTMLDLAPDDISIHVYTRSHQHLHEIIQHIKYYTYVQNAGGTNHHTSYPQTTCLITLTLQSKNIMGMGTVYNNTYKCALINNYNNVLGPQLEIPGCSFRT